MRQKLLTILSLVSLVLCVATAATWVIARSQCTWAVRFASDGGRSWSARGGADKRDLNRFSLATIAARPHPPYREAYVFRGPFSLAPKHRVVVQVMGAYNAAHKVNKWQFGGLAVSHGERSVTLWIPASASGGSKEFIEVGQPMWVWLCQVPYWMLAVVSGVMPIWMAIQYATGRRHRKPDRCRRCGYDLRATPDRCPECGTIPKSKSVAIKTG